MAAIFDLGGKARGLWDVVLTNANGDSATLPNGFTIEEGRVPHVWLDVLGRDAVRPGETHTYTILVGNSGDGDAYGIPLFLGYSSFVGTARLFNLINPPPIPGQPPIDYHQIPVTSPGSNGRTLVPLFIPVLKAHQTLAFRFSVIVPRDTNESSFDSSTATSLTRRWSRPSFSRANTGGDSARSR